MEYYYAKPDKNRKDGTCRGMIFPRCMAFTAISVIFNIIISVKRVIALLIRVTANSLLGLFLIKPGLKWK